MLVVPEDKPGLGVTTTFTQLHHRFRKFNTVEGPDGKQLFFRYYDPRVIVDVLKALNSKQIEEFFGALAAIALTSQNKQTITVSKDQLAHVKAHATSA